MLKDVPHLRRGQPPVDRHNDRAEVVRGEDRFEELWAVVGEKSDDVATSDASFGQAAGQPGRPRRHLPVGGRLAPAHVARRGVDLAIEIADARQV